jgi:hypothetical protein
MTSLTTTITARIEAALTNTMDLGTGVTSVDEHIRQSWASGTGDDQGDIIWHDQRTIAASANEDLDLAGVLADAYGNTLTFVELKAVLIKAASDNTNNVRLTRPAANGVPLFLAASDGIDVTPGGVFLWTSPADGGVTVTAGTGDLLNVANSSSGSTVTYDIILIGASA